MKRSKSSEVKSVIARVEKDFRSKRKSSSLPRERIASSSQGREASPQHHLMKDAWFGPQPRGQRKQARPFHSNQPMEVKFTSLRARGRWSFRRSENRKRIDLLLRGEAEKNSVLIKRVSLEGEGSILICLETKERKNLSRFLRAVAGRIPRVVAGAERGRPLTPPGRGFWAGLVSSRCKPTHGD